MELKDWLTLILIPASIAVWKLSEKILQKWGEAKIEAERRRAEAAIEAQRDEMEHKQELEKDSQQRKKLELLAAMGNQTFKDEQLTTMTAELQMEASTANEYVRSQHEKLTERMVTKEEMRANTTSLNLVNQRLATIETYLRSVVHEFKERERESVKANNGEAFELISELQERLAKVESQTRNVSNPPD